jgi:6-phosphogluconate dehydrogenase
VELGMIGLGRMGSNMVARIEAAGHRCVVYDRSADAVAAAESDGATAATSMADLAAKLGAPRSVWIMVPAGVTRAVMRELAEHLEPGDTIVDGGNSRWLDDLAAASELSEKGIHHVDVGTSGGVWGRERGYCLMIGGDDEPVARLEPIFEALAPGVGAAPRTRDGDGEPAPAERGWYHCGPPGAGHFVKMVHNGIEYGVMAAYAEGLAVLRHANEGTAEAGEADAETTPLADPEAYRYDIDVSQVAEVWRRGSVVSSWLLDLTAAALVDDPTLERYGGRVSDSGEGRWTVQAAVDLGVPAPVITAALYDRFSSRGRADFGDRVLSAMRFAFGGHLEQGGPDQGGGTP